MLQTIYRCYHVQFIGVTMYSLFNLFSTNTDSTIILYHKKTLAMRASVLSLFRSGETVFL